MVVNPLNNVHCLTVYFPIKHATSSHFWHCKRHAASMSALRHIFPQDFTAMTAVRLYRYTCNRSARLWQGR